MRVYQFFGHDIDVIRALALPTFVDSTFSL
jgi:hypothetical protein